MITPREIEKKADNIYKKFLKDWICSDSNASDFFPVRIPANLSPVRHDVNEAASAIESLRRQSKESRGWGYRLDWKHRRDQSLGRNQYPIAIHVDTVDDLLRLTGKIDEFEATKVVANKISTALPRLKDWMVSSVAQLHKHHDYIDSLLATTEFFLANPWPDCYARQIPVPVDTKFVSRHRQILHQWLDILLPPSAVDVNESRFERRFGLRDADQHRAIRLLDPVLKSELGLPFDEFSLPMWELNKLQVERATVLVVENRLNLLTIPATARAIAIRGEGRAVTRLGKLPWLESAPIYYWGDIDVDGFLILSAMRNLFPQTRSFLMDSGTLGDHKDSQIEGNGNLAHSPSNLTDAEKEAFAICSRNNIRLEQEKIRQSYVEDRFQSSMLLG